MTRTGSQWHVHAGLRGEHVKTSQTNSLADDRLALSGTTQIFP